MAKDSKTTRTPVRKPAKAKRTNPHVVDEVLRGPVVDVFLQNIPVFKGLGREQAFELVMSNPQLVEECFKLFRKRPELFEQLIVDAKGNPITDEQQELVCGRSLAEVVALIVRAAAKRHFQSRLGVPQAADPAPPPPPKVSGWRRLLARFVPPPPPDPPPKRKATRADRLYRAMHGSLLYEWQLPLIKHYAPLPVSTVRQLGPRILEFREPQALKVLLTEGPPAPQPTSPPATPAPSRPAPSVAVPRTMSGTAPPPRSAKLGAPAGSSPGGSPGAPPGGAPAGNRAESMWKIGQSLQLHKLFAIDEAELRRTIAQASGVGGHVFSGFGSIGLKLRESVVVLCTIDRQLGHGKMRELLGSDSTSGFVSEMAMLMRQEGVAAMEAPEEIRKTIQMILNQMKKQGRY